MSSSNLPAVLAAKLAALPTRTANQDRLLNTCQWSHLPRHALALYDLELHLRSRLTIDLAEPVDWSQSTFVATSANGNPFTVSVTPNWTNLLAFLEQLLTLLGPFLMIFLGEEPLPVQHNGQGVTFF